MKTNYSLLVARGVGFVNDIRISKDPTGQLSDCMHMNISALHGKQAELHRGIYAKTFFSVRITDENARALFLKLTKAHPGMFCKSPKKRPRVFIGFTVTGLMPTSYEKAGKKPQRIHCIEGNLTDFLFINVNGEKFYNAQNAQNVNSGAAMNFEDNAEASNDELMAIEA